MLMDSQENQVKNVKKPLESFARDALGRIQTKTSGQRRCSESIIEKIISKAAYISFPSPSSPLLCHALNCG